jgi:hypothetical protein
MTLAGNQEKKTCRYCAETVPTAAKLCPRCRQWLSFRSFRNPVVGLCMTMLPLIASGVILIYGLTNLFERISSPPPYYSDFQSSLRVVESQMNWADTVDGRRIYITGVVTNQSPMAWRSLEFDTRFFNASGQMIDVANGRASFTILPGNESAFRVSVMPLVSSNEYNSFKISVSNARSTKGAF